MNLLDRVLGRLLPVSRKGSIHRFYLRRGSEGVSGWRAWGLFVHRIVRSDAAEVFHNHPWNGVALIFGGYWEETPTTPLRWVSGLNWIGHQRSHRVEIERPTWTLFLHFERANGAWGFHDRSRRPCDVEGRPLAPSPGPAVSPWRGPDRDEDTLLDGPLAAW